MTRDETNAPSKRRRNYSALANDADDDAHDVCFIVVAIFVDGTEILFGKEALPLALPINRYHC